MRMHSLIIPGGAAAEFEMPLYKAAPLVPLATYHDDNMGNRKSNRASPGMRRQRSVTPVRAHKKSEHRDSQKRHMKKQQQMQIRRRKQSAEVMKKKREGWAQVALETQRIVLGDGKYVEERNVSSDPHEMTVTAQGLGSHTLMPLNFKRLGVVHDISMQIELSKQQTVSYPHYSEKLATWAASIPSIPDPRPSTVIEFTKLSALAAARRLHATYPHLHEQSTSALDKTKIGVMSFASPKRPGGGYLHGGDEQEEVIARSSSLVAALGSPQAATFYQTHRQYKNEDGSGLHDHSMVYSPGIVVFRKEDEELEEEQPVTRGRRKRNDTPAPVVTDPSGAFIEPFLVNVVSAVPVNAAAVRQKHVIPPEDAQFFADGIRHAMKERMARVLRCFEDNGDRALVLGAFGCGSSENDPEVIADIWAELLVTGDRAAEGKENKPARFKDVFERVVFAVPGKWHAPFKRAFEMRVFEQEVTDGTSSGDP